MPFVLSMLLNYILTRVVRLRHPEKELFVGGPDFYPFLTDLESSNVFEDIEVPNISDKIIIGVRDSKNKVLDVEASGKNLIYYRKHGNKNQHFKVIHLARDVIAIESALGGCLQFHEGNKRFELKDCASGSKYLNQIFLITDEDGIWKGHGSYDNGWGLPLEETVSWGVCPTCIRGGFGSNEQGDSLDSVANEDQDEGGKKEDKSSNALMTGETIDHDPLHPKLGIKRDGFNVDGHIMHDSEPAQLPKGVMVGDNGPINRIPGERPAIGFGDGKLHQGMAEYGVPNPFQADHERDKVVSYTLGGKRHHLITIH